MAVEDSIDSLIGGVSQQAAALRFKSQADLIENCWLSPTQGLVPRSHTTHRKSLFTGKGGPFFAHGIDRDRLERYVLLLRQQELLAFDLRGDSFPYRWDRRQLVESPEVITSGAGWTLTGAGQTITAEPGAIEDPLGAVDDGIIQVEIATGTGGQSFEQDIDKIDGAGSNKRTIVSGRPYIIWFWLEPGTTPVEKTRIEILGQSAARSTLMEIDWTFILDYEVSLFTPVGAGKHDHGVISRGDGWYIAWAVVTWDAAGDSNGFTVKVTADVNTVAATRTLNLWHIMVEEWDPVLEGPGLLWTDAIQPSQIVLSGHTSYFDLRQTNPIGDPETFKEVASSGAWSLGSQAAAAVVSAFANPFAFASGNKFYQKLQHNGGGLITDGAYFQTVGKIYPGPQLYLCHFRKEDSTAGVTIRLNVRDTVGAQSTVQDFEWSGTDLVLKGVPSGAFLSVGVLQSPFDDEDWIAFIVAHPSEHASVTAGNARDLYVYVFTDPVSVAHTYAFGALVIDGERVAKFLDYVNPIRNIRALTVQDATFLVNPDVKTERFPLKTPEDPTDKRAYFFVKQGGFNNEYIIRIMYTDGTKDEVFATTWDNDVQAGKCIFSFGDTQTECQTNGGTWQPSDEDMKTSETQEIAAKLGSDLNAISGIAAQSIGSVVEIFISGAKKIERIETEDSQGDTALIAIWRDVKRVQDLPKDLRDQWRIRVRGDAGASDEPVYYLMFIVDGESGDFGTGRWVESTYWDAEDMINPETMPHQIVRRQDDATGEITGTPNQLYFDIAQVNWGRRLAGDNDTNRFPPMISTDFVDAFVQDLFFVQSRLGFLSGESINFSEVGRFFQLFRSTVIDVNDADAFSGSSSSTRAAILRHAIVLDERLVVGSDDTEFVIEGEPLLSSKTFQAIPSLEQETLGRARWVKSKAGIFAGFPKRADSDDTFQHSGVAEILSGRSTTGPELSGDDITSAVPAYLEGEVEYMASRPSLGLLLVAMEGGRCFPYKFFEAGGQVQQQAWSEWIFGGEQVAFVAFARTEAIFIIRREEGVFLETMRIGENLVDDGSTIVTRLDRRLDQDDVTLVYDSVDDETTITLPYDIRTGSSMLVVDKTSLVQYVVKSATALAPTLIVQGDRTSDSLWIGESYVAKYRFTKPFLRTQDASKAVQKLSSGKVTILQGILTFADTAAFDVSVAHRHGDTFLEPYSSFIVGTPDADLGAVVLLSDEFEFGVGDEPEEVTIEITGRAHLPFQMLKAVWTGHYAPRSRPVRA